MPPSLRIAYLAHSLRSDWNNGNAHFLRGLLRNLAELGHNVSVFEPRAGWSFVNLQSEPAGAQALRQFAEVYGGLSITTYEPDAMGDADYWRPLLAEMDVVILHEWNEPELAATLLALRESQGFRLFFHDTHHRASSSPESIASFGLDRFDGVLAFGESLRHIYAERFGITRVWTLHEAADTAVFRPLEAAAKVNDVVWIGNWGDDERSAEIRHFLLEPAAALAEQRFTVYGVRYPEQALEELRRAGVSYRGYLPNLAAPAVYAASRLTLHIPRQH